MGERHGIQPQNGILGFSLHFPIDRIPRQIFRFPHFQSEIQRTYWLPENYLTLRRQIWPAE